MVVAAAVVAAASPDPGRAVRWCRAGLAATTAFAVAACGGGGTGSVAPPPPATLAVAGGADQSAPAGTTLPVAVTVALRDGAGRPRAGVTVAWRVVSGGATLAPRAAATDADGLARADVTLAAPGSVVLRAEVAEASVDVAAFALAPGSIVPVAALPIPPDYGIHDQFVRDGLAFVCAWNTGLVIYDVGNGVKGGSPSRPVEVSRIVPTRPGGQAGNIHNAWWYHDAGTGATRYVFLGQELPARIGSSSAGDIFVVDVSDLAHPVTVAWFGFPGAGTHNFWVDEAAGVLYAAYYNGGVVALDVRGTLAGDLTPRLLGVVQPGGTGNTYTWGVMLHRGSLYASDMLSGLWQLAPAAGQLATRGGGNNVPERYTSDLWLSGDWAYTGTWGSLPRSGVLGNALKVWHLDAQGAPTLVDSLVLPGIATVSDVEVTDDGGTLLLTAENGPGGGLYLYRLLDPQRPAAAGQALVDRGLHTGTFARIGGRRFVFAAKNPPDPALRIFDVTAATN